MKFGFRIPSIGKRISARLSPARYVRHSLGFKAPRCWGWLTNPKKALYNRIYNRTTFGVDDLVNSAKRKSGGRVLFWLVVMAVLGMLWRSFAA